MEYINMAEYGDDLQYLLAKAKMVSMTAEEKEAQRRSFAYGNTNIENPRITKDVIDREAEKLRRERGK